MQMNSVNRSLTDPWFDDIDHALGRPADPLKESYRNYYAIGAELPLAGAMDMSPHDATEKADDAAPTQDTSSALFEHRADHPMDTPAQGREAVPGGGT